MTLPDLSDSIIGAKSLLGWELIQRSSQGITSGYIVETESYDMNDPASHAYAGLTKRNASMFETRGTIYVYFTYGMHFCVNIVTGNKGHGQGVLIRALEPVKGLEMMKKRRGLNDIAQLTNGPGKLTQAMGIDKALNGSHLSNGALTLVPGKPVDQIVQTTRIGIKKAIDQPWRFYVADSPYVSRK